MPIREMTFHDEGDVVCITKKKCGGSYIVFEKKFVTLHRKFDEMTRREINIVKREQKMAETFGHSNIFAILSLSLMR